ncbi:MAG: Gfo/Idh/MocA family oxidoreductase [Ruminococcaceae bacterium]|nr:Gfo/Idh/MocA family oxidoreductase [Oscillospiraceae bacterium]
MEAEKKVVKIGAVGLGRGRYMLSYIANDDNVKVTAVCDKNPEAIKATHKMLKENNSIDPSEYESFESYEEFLKSDVDAVYICTDAPLHTEQVIMALEAGKHVLEEVPAVQTVEEAKALKAAVSAHPDLTFMFAENVCYVANIQTWKKMYDDGEFGDVVLAEAEYIHTFDYKNYYDEDGNLKPVKETWRTYHPAIHYLTHSLGPLLYIMNDRCVSVSCFESDIQYNPNKKVSANAVAIMKTEKGAIIRINIIFGAYAGFDHNFRIIGTRGSIMTDPTKAWEKANSFAQLSSIPGTFETKMEIPVAISYPGESDLQGHGGCDVVTFRKFIECIVKGKKPELDIDFAINASLPGTIAHISAENGGNALEIPVID